MNRVFALRMCATLVCVWMSLSFAPASFAQTLAPAELLKRGLKYYQELEFTKARQDLEAYLRTPDLTKAQKLEALRFLALCYYNEGQQSQAKGVWQQVLAIDATAKLPPGQSPTVQQFFSSIRPNVEPLRPPPRTRLITPTPPPGGFRHTISLVTLGVGVVAAGVAIAFGSMAQQGMEQVYQQSDANTAVTQFQSVQTNATVATALWITSATLGTGGIVILIVELATAPRAPAATAQRTIPTRTAHIATSPREISLLKRSPSTLLRSH